MFPSALIFGPTGETRIDPVGAMGPGDGPMSRRGLYPYLNTLREQTHLAYFQTVEVPLLGPFIYVGSGRARPYVIQPVASDLH
jgi:hypothetical protein